MTCTHFSSDEYAFYALGSLAADQSQPLEAHLRSGCELCADETKEALDTWVALAALTEQTQFGGKCADPPPALRNRVIAIGRERLTSIASRPPALRPWLRIAAGIVLTASAAALSWNIERLRAKDEISSAQVRIEQQSDAVRKLEAENNSLKNLVVAARNAPPTFPGRESIVSVQDPYLLRDLQRARQTQVAASATLNEERTRTADLQKRLTQTTALLAAATRDREEADRQYRKAFDAEAASIDTQRGAEKLSQEISAYGNKIRELQSEIVRDRALLNLQSKKVEQNAQIMALLQSRSLVLVQLNSRGAASGAALIADNSRLSFFPSNLAAAPAGRIYQLWLIREKGTISAGTFTSGDASSVQFNNAELLKGVKSLMVTEEPAGGSPTPTGRKVMAGSVPQN